MPTSCYFAKVSCAGFPTRTRPDQPIAIVIHYLSADYTTVMNSQIIQTAQTAQWDTAQGYHYVISDTGITIELVNPTLQIPNLHEYTNPTWTEQPEDGAGETDPDEVVIHVALTNIQLPCNSYTQAQERELIRLLCCLVEAFNSTISVTSNHIFLPPAIDAEQTDYYDGSSIPDELLTDVSACLSGDIVFPGDNPATASCCDTITEAQEELAERVTTAEGKITDLEDEVEALTERVVELEQWQATVAPGLAESLAKYDALVLQVQGLQQYLASIQPCLDTVCPANLSCGVIEYSLSQAQDFQAVNPNINRWVNFPDKISDLSPATVRAGALWTANLPAGNYGIVVTARLSSSDYVNGEKVWLELVYCNQRIRIAEKTLTTGAQVVNIDSDTDKTTAWDDEDQEITIASPCADFHIEIGTDSISSIPAYKTLENASIVITPII